MNKLLLVLFVSAQALHLRPTTGLNDETKTEETDQLAQEVQYDGKVLSSSEAKDKMAKSTVVFMLPAKLDRSKHLPYLRANIEKVGALFKEFAVVVGTPNVEAEAQQWKEEAKAGKCSATVCSGSAKPYDVFVTTEEKNSNVDCGKWVFFNLVGKITKACKIGKGRDAILKEIFDNHKGKFDYAIAVDSDMTKQWSTQSFLKAFSLGGDWSMVASNGVSSDTHEMQDWFGWKSNHKYAQGTRFGADEPAFQVKGAFGGVALFRTDAMEGCSYTSCMKNCEHNCFEDCMAKKGHKLYMHPGFVVEWPMYKKDMSENGKMFARKATDEERLQDVAATWNSPAPTYTFTGKWNKWNQH